MNDVIQFLKRLGLTTTEISLYLNGLKFRTVRVAKLVEMSGIKRTTAYHALDTLIEKGLASQSKQDGRLQYKMTPPDKLKILLHNKKVQLESQVDTLESLIPQFPLPLVDQETTPEVTNYYGIEGVHVAIDKALYCKERSWRIIAPRSNFFRNSSPEYIEYFKRIRIEREIRAKSLWELPSATSVITEKDQAHRQPRILPEQMRGSFKSSIIIFDCHVLIISSYNKQFATLIKGIESTQTLSVMFDTIWSISQPLEGNRQ